MCCFLTYFAYERTVLLEAVSNVARGSTNDFTEYEEAFENRLAEHEPFRQGHFASQNQKTGETQILREEAGAVAA
jgi:hypothetical protein